MDIVGLPENLKGADVEAAMLNVFEVAGVPMKKRDFHAIHRLRNTRMIIARFVIAEMRLQSFAIRRHFLG